MYVKTLPLAVLLILSISCGTQQSAQSNNAETQEAKTYKLRGNEPFWNIVIEPSAITFNQLGEEPESYPYRSPITQKETVIFETDLEKEGKTSRLKIHITESACTDNMSGEKFPYSVVVDKNGKSFNGCGN